MPKPSVDTDELVPYWQTNDKSTVRLYLGNVTDVLSRMEPKSVHCVVTSPPYWSLRSYLDDTHKDKKLELGSEPSSDCNTHGQAQCGKCFVCSMVKVFRGVYRVLRDDSCCFINLGDTYGPNGQLQGIPWRVALALQADRWVLRSDIPFVKLSPMPESTKNRPAKSLEYVFMFTKKMGYFYDDIPIRKPATPAERVVNGKTGSAGQASGKGVKPTGNAKPGSNNRTGDTRNFWQTDLWFESVNNPHGLVGVGDELVGIEMTSQGYSGAHFATFSKRLIEPFIKASTSERGCCAKCGSPWKRVTDTQQLTRDRPNDFVKRKGEKGTGNSCSNSVAGVNVKTIAWEPTCECCGKFVKSKGTRMGHGSYHDHLEDGVTYGLRQQGKGPASVIGEPTKELETTLVKYISYLPLDKHPIKPCTVLDPFIGSGTSCVVSLEHGRNSIGIDLSEKYLKNNAIPRIEGAIQSRPSLLHLIRKRIKPMSIGKILTIGKDITNG